MRAVELLGLTLSLVVYYGQPWRRRALARLYRELIEPGALAFDIGAHVGNRTHSLRALNARCVVVEPQPHFVRFLSWLFAGDASVAVIAAALGRAPGQAQIRMSARHPTVSTLSIDWQSRVGSTEGFRHVRWDSAAEVAVTTLDALIGEFGLPDFCKIDVEGFEADILAGLSTPIPLIAFEYTPATPDITDACLDRLAQLGRYRFNISEAETHRLDLKHWVTASELRRSLGDMNQTAPSGDIYARLEKPDA